MQQTFPPMSRRAEHGEQLGLLGKQRGSGGGEQGYDQDRIFMIFPHRGEFLLRVSKWRRTSELVPLHG